jgi:TRAP-type mannitol/chloroaromatic compound transport system permease large subunit
MFEAYVSVTAPEAAPFTAMQTIDSSRMVSDSAGGVQEPSAAGGLQEPPMAGGLQEPPAAEGVQEPPAEGGVQEPPAEGKVEEPPGTVAEPPAAKAPAKAAAKKASAADDAAEGPAAPRGFWITLGIGTLLLAGFYAIFSVKRLEIFKMLLSSFFPLVILILAVLGSIVFGLTTPTEAAAVGAFGGFVLASAYLLLNYPGPRIRKILLVWIPLWTPFVISVVWFRLAVADAAPPVPTWFGLIAIIGIGIWSLLVLKQIGMTNTVKESSYLTAKTSAMVCWLFVGSSIFSAAFALLGGQELVERWVLSMDLTPTQFLILSQFIIFVLGWPLEWTEIIVIFMPIFVPLLDNFGVDPLLFGLLVALNLQTAFLSPPVAMSAFYLKGVSPPHVTLNQIFAGMMPFMGIQVIAIVMLYIFPQVGLWLPSVVYGR